MTDLNNVVKREELKDKIEEFVEVEIRPFVQSDGGDIEIIELQPDGILRVMLHGACSSCPSSILTLKFGAERRVIEMFPEIKGLELAGLTPFINPHLEEHNETSEDDSIP